MGLNLNGVTVLSQSQLLEHASAEGGPVDFRIGGKVRVVVARCTIELGQRFDAFDDLYGTIEARGYVGELFAQGSGAGRLAVCTRQQGLVRKLQRVGL